MEDHEGFGFDEFSVEIEDFEYKQVKKFDRIFNLGEGGSFTQNPCVHGGRVFVGCLDRNVYAINANTGKLLWKFQTGGSVGPASPLFHEGAIYVGSYDQNMYALDSETGKLIWKFHTKGKIAGCAAVHNGKLYFGSNDYNLYCLDPKTGRLIWKYATRGEIPSRPTPYRDKILCGSYDHFLYCLDAENGFLIWKFETQGDVFHIPSLLVHEDIIYFPSFDNFLRAVDVGTGKLKWKFKTGSFGGMGCGPVLCDNALFQVNREGIIYSLTMDGKEIWKFKINNAMAHPMIHRKKLYFGSEDRNLYCLDMNGNVLWKFPTQGMMWWMPTIWEDKIYFVSWDCFLYCVDINTHRLLWKFRGQGSPSYNPPPFESYELTVKKEVPETGLEETETRKRYDFGMTEEDHMSQYKSRVTYQMSTQYQSKGGKYQVDSDEEAL